MQYVIIALVHFVIHFLYGLFMPDVAYDFYWAVHI